MCLFQVAPIATPGAAEPVEALSVTPIVSRATSSASRQFEWFPHEASSNLRVGVRARVRVRVRVRVRGQEFFEFVTGDRTR